MVDKVVFTNKETGKNINVDLKTQFVVIFGKNGSGKTTFSRSNFFSKDFVFNTDFIHKNIYIETTDGAVEDAENKKRFSSMWICENVVEIKKKISNLKNILKQITNSFESILNSIKQSFADNTIKLESIDLSKIDEAIKGKKISLPDKDDWATFVSQHKRIYAVKSTILDAKDFSDKLIQLKDNSLLMSLVDRIKVDKLLEWLLLGIDNNSNKELNSLIVSYNSSINQLKECDTAFIGENINIHKEWVRTGLELHEKTNSNTCLFCGNKQIEESTKKWKKILESNVSKNRDKILTKLEGTIKHVNDILVSRTQYEKLCKNTIIALEVLKKDFSERSTNIKSYKNVKEGFDDLIALNKDKLIIDESKLLENIKLYLLDPFIAKYEAHKLLINIYGSKIKDEDKILKGELIKSADTIKKSINDKLKDLGFEKELQIKIDSRGAETKYNFQFVNTATRISTLSDGQKHKLALAIFLAKLENQSEKINNVVLDDPVVTLDFQTYYRVKNEIINLTKSGKYEHVILLTYNISFLYVQLSNLFNNQGASICTFYHLFPNSCENIDLNILNYDDLVLYRKCLDNVNDFEEFNLLASMNFRIMRVFIDMKTRMLGKPDSGNPENAIDSLSCFDSSGKDMLKDLSGKISKIFYDKNSKNSDLYKSFILLNELSNKLGFSDFLNTDELNRLKRFSNKNIRSMPYSGNNLLYLIIEWALKNKDSLTPIEKHIRDYIHHPRNQLTKSVIGIDFTDNDGHFAS